jgi:hypothetical protein
MTVLLSLLILSTASPALELPPPLRALLDTGRWDSTPKGFRIIALSHVADGCAQQARAHPERRAAAARCLERILELADRTRPARTDAQVVDGLWLSHLALILGAADAVGPCLNPVRHRAIAQRLARESLEDPHAHVASYGTQPFRWPADQAATLAALGRFDSAHRESLGAKPLAAWKKAMVLSPSWGIPISEVSRKAKGAAHPRGCAQSFMTRYLAEVDAPLAAEWWSRYRKHFMVRFPGVVGFREWPPGVERAADVDSGPIIMGVGAAASAFAIAAARSQGDEPLALELEAAADVVSRFVRQAETLLAHAIRFQARWQPSPR